MIKKIRILSLIFAACFVLGGCGGTEGGNDSLPEDTSPISEETAQALIEIIKDGSSDYQIVTAMNTGTELEKAISKFKDTVKKNTGVPLRLINDYKKENADAVGEAHERLIGVTNRQASVEASEGLRSNDYRVTVYKNQLVIVGGSEKATITALDAFCKGYFDRDTSGELIVYDSDLYEYSAEYPIDTLTLNGKPISDYRIVYADKSVYMESAAKKLCSLISEKVGVEMEIVSDATENLRNLPELIVGETNRATDSSSAVGKNCAVFSSEGNSIRIIGDSANNTIRGVEAFVREYMSGSGGVNAAVPDKKSVGLGADADYTVMSFNILYSDPEERVHLTAQAILDVMPDSVGIQEFTEKWKPLLDEKLGQYYARVGEEIKAGYNIYNVIYYRKDKFKLIETGQLWLSDTPGKVSKLTTSNQYRAVTYALLEDIATGERFMHYNTHLDIVRVAAGDQLKILQNITAECEYPYIVTGDFNIDYTWNLYENMQRTWYDSRKLAAVTDDPQIDYCMVVDSIVVSEYHVMDEPYPSKKQFEAGQTKGYDTYISDHWPVYIKFNINS